VKVHVSVIYPSDFSFRSHRIVPPIPITPDNIIRDHRKIVFYDLNEANAYRGAMFVMGVGIGEHYASATWEDRGYRVRGPAALEVRAAVRRALRANGFREQDIPEPLRAVESPEAAEQRMDLGDYVGRALQVHNETGFGRKESSVARAMLYNLAPPGSLIIVPDPLWLSAEWAAMLAGAAARGCHVIIIAPALANAPSPQAPLMVVMHDVMTRLLAMRERLGPQLREARGEIRVGLFTGQAHVTDVEGRRREIRAGLQRAPWIRELIPFDAQTLAVLERAATQTEADGRDATAMAKDEKPRPPQLHQKTQLVARPGAISVLVRQRAWDDVLARAMQVQSQQTARFAEQLGYVTPEVEAEATRSADVILRGFEESLPEAERKNVSFYFTLGTQNQDPRGMLLDAEATMVVSGFHGAAGLVDLYFIMARSTWISRQSELDRLLPPRRGLMRRVARLIRIGL
jgi:phosphatidylserine/phosphatidylglycerophosphate/cardiolipin synthase-like enzyme